MILMIGVTAICGRAGTIRWVHANERLSSFEDGFQISFELSGDAIPRVASRGVQRILAKNGISWLTMAGGRWNFDAPLFKSWYAKMGGPPDRVSRFLARLEWMRTAIAVTPDVETIV